MIIRTTAFCFALFAVSAAAFVLPWTTEKRVAAASVIAVIKIKEGDRYHVGGAKEFSEALVIEGILGAKNGDVVRIWDEVFINDDGEEYTISGRDPYLQQGKQYFIYLREDQRGRLVTVQSSLDSLDVVDDQVEKEGEAGFEPLAKKIEKTLELIAEQLKTQQGVAPQSASRCKPDPEGVDRPQTKSEERSQ